MEEMNVEIFKRNITLHRLGIGELELVEKLVYECLVDNLSRLNKYVLDEHSDYLYFGKSIDEIVLIYNRKDNFLYVRSIIMLPLLGIYPSVNRFSAIQALIIYWVGVTLELKPVGITYGGYIDELISDASVGLRRKINR